MTERDNIRQRAAAEVLELGEMLFDTAIDAALRQPTKGEDPDVSLVEEMHAAADEFFTALRLLLGTELQSTEADKSAMCTINRHLRIHLLTSIIRPLRPVRFRLADCLRTIHTPVMGGVVPLAGARSINV
jgi:hypothetical protein